MNTVIVTEPHRHDLQVTSCVKKEVRVFSTKKHKMMKIAYNMNISRNEVETILPATV
jgi:hypothetical protein